MTIIEFYNKTAIENMLSALLCEPDRVVYIGHNRKQMKSCMNAYREVLRKRGLSVELLPPKSVNRNNLQSIVDALSEIVEQYDDCVFNLDGGEDLYLVAVGIVAQKYPGRIGLNRFNIRNNTITDCDADGVTHLTSPIEISIEENIRIYGGRVVSVEQHSDGTFPWDFSPEFRWDLHSLWALSCRYKRSWNGQMNTLGWVNKLCPQADPMALHAVRDQVESEMLKEGDYYKVNIGILRSLEEAGFISRLRIRGDEVELVFKNEQIKRCLTKAGQVLELMTTMAALDAAEDDGTAVYNDVQCGVYIDWDGHVAPEGDVDVNNEIDVFLMKGAVPVFVSCKNGGVKQDELYKLETVAQRFGDKYARKVLVAPYLDKNSDHGRYIRARANDMDIRIVDDFDDMTYEQMIHEMKCLWLNPK